MAKDKGSQSHLLDLLRNERLYLETINHILHPLGAKVETEFHRHPLKRGSKEDEAEWTAQHFIYEHYDRKSFIQNRGQLWAAPRPPQWDLISACAIECDAPCRKGLLLVEAKAHEGELSWAGKGLKPDASFRSKENHDRIDEHVGVAGRWLNKHLPGVYHLDIRDRYQLANRMTTLAMVARLGIPVVLVYLGFTHSQEDFPRDFFLDSDHWQRCMGAYLHGVVPNGIVGTLLPAADMDFGWEKMIALGPGSRRHPIVYEPRCNYVAVAVGSCDVRHINA